MQLNAKTMKNFTDITDKNNLPPGDKAEVQRRIQKIHLFFCEAFSL